MKAKLLAAGMAALCTSSLAMTETNDKELTLERIFANPSLTGKAPNALKFSPDGQRVTFLRNKPQDQHRYDLWEYHLPSGETRMLVDSASLHAGPEELSDEEKARRERRRAYGQGIMEYEWSEDGEALLFPLAGDIYHYRLDTRKVKRLTETAAFETDIRFSPKGTYVSFVRDQNLYAVEIASGKEIQLTRDGGGTIKNGMAEFVAQEEMERMTGYWWAPDESRLAFTRVDESPVEEVMRNEIHAEEIKLYQQRYPATGTPNVRIQLGVLRLDKGATTWLDLGGEEDIYLPRVQWLRDSRHLSYQWQSRDQKTLKLIFADTGSGRQRTILTEKSDTWINLHNDLHFLKNGKEFIWASERDGFKHLYLYDTNGKQIRQLTRGNWVVDNLEHVDEKARKAYFSGRADTPLERHLYAISLDGKGRREKITSRNGFHSITFAEDGQSYLDNFSSRTQPPQVSLHTSAGQRITWLEENKLDSHHPLTPYMPNWVAPEFGRLKAEDGQPLHYEIYRPKNFDPDKKYPVIVQVYGGPRAQEVTNSWGSYWTQYMLQQGYIMFRLDNRGSHYRGTRFENPIYRQLGELELRDQIEGVEYLRGLPYVDAERVGIHGHSYGGYMALMAMFKAGDYFAAGVAGAPVTDWKFYDTHYTERYLGHPQDNAEGYEKSSVFPYAEGLKGPLLIYHGMADDNVLFKNSTKLYQQLQDLGKPFEMMNYPGAKHSLFGEKTRIHQYRTITSFFNRYMR